MKKNVIKLDRMLALDKETIAQLDEDQLGILAGGQAETATCNVSKIDNEESPDTGSCLACTCNQF